jgi:amino acid transporter
VHDGGARELSPRLGLFPVTNIVVANMIGAGIFTTSGLLLQELGSPALTGKVLARSRTWSVPSSPRSQD